MNELLDWQAIATALVVACVILGVVAWDYRVSSFGWKARSQHWFSVAMGEKPMIDETGAQKMMRDLFPRPMGVPSPHRIVLSQAQREHRAVRGLDHWRRHSVDAACDSEAATEILMFTVGGWEQDV